MATGKLLIPLALAFPAFMPITGRSSAESRKPERGIHALSWLAGSWSGEHDGGIIEEHWTPPGGRTMIGMSRLVVEGETVFHEYLRIVEKEDGSIHYVAQPRGRCPAVEFRLTEIEVGRAVFENPAHDDPKIIRYALDERDVLTATTEGERDGKRTTHDYSMRRH